MKKSSAISLLFFLLLLLMHPQKLNAQGFLPFSQSNYSGVSGLLLQPASIADSRYRFDMALFGFELSVNNDFVSLDRRAFFKPDLWEQENFGTDYVNRKYNGKDKSAFVNGGAILPSFMININNNTAIGFTSRVRAFANIDNISEDLAQLVSEKFDYEDLWFKTLTNANFSMQTNTWAEVGFSIATVLLNKEKHFLKGGISLKYLQGLGSGYMYVDNLSYRFSTPDTLSLFRSDINYGISESFDEDGKFTTENLPGPGFGIDLGFVYEYRPDIKKYTYSLDGQDGLLMRNKDKYLFRIGVSLLDLGSIRYDKGLNTQNFRADVENWYIKGFEINSVNDVAKIIEDQFYPGKISNESYRMALPTALSLQLDYNLGSDFYLNFTPFLALRKGTGLESKSHYATSYTFTPRYDIQWFGVAMPLQLDDYNRFNAGLSFRLGSFWIGSNSIITNRLARESYSMDFYVMAKIPIFRKADKDGDRDGVSDAKDQCPDLQGSWPMLGCPDADGDSIPDHLDDCPFEAGAAALKGCPDRDGDGIADKDDRCPDHAGLPELDGCPDSDGDRIPDHLDDCPDQPGTAALNGCPDRDGDGIPDRIDFCPDTPGKPEFNGCPFADTDKDGIPDEEDECPTIPGKPEFMGCPDTDNDGISDKYDRCPTIPGVPENNGCPEIKKEEKAIIDRAFSNLEFESGKAIIKKNSYPSLDELASLLIERPQWKVQLSGHTDNTGNPESNMALSRNRSQAVKDYLIMKGVEEYRIRTEWFGQELPVADNKTAAGRQKNRRVEMKIVFD